MTGHSLTPPTILTGEFAKKRTDGVEYVSPEFFRIFHGRYSKIKIDYGVKPTAYYGVIRDASGGIDTEVPLSEVSMSKVRKASLFKQDLGITEQILREEPLLLDAKLSENITIVLARRKKAFAHLLTLMSIIVMIIGANSLFAVQQLNPLNGNSFSLPNFLTVAFIFTLALSCIYVLYQSIVSVSAD